MQQPRSVIDIHSVIFDIPRRYVLDWEKQAPTLKDILHGLEAPAKTSASSTTKSAHNLHLAIIKHASLLSSATKW
jgi:hypothetical protein